MRGYPLGEQEQKRQDRWPLHCPFCLILLRDVAQWEQFASSDLLEVDSRHSKCGHILTYRGAKGFFSHITRR